MPERNVTPEDKGQQPLSYTPASFEKRAAAWMGIAYVVMFMLLTLYTLSTARNMPGTFPLFLVPVAVTRLVIAVRRRKLGLAGLPFTILMVILCIAAVAVGLLLGVPALVAALQGAR